MAKWHPAMYFSPDIPQENPILDPIRDTFFCCTSGETKENNDTVDHNTNTNSNLGS